MRRNIQPDELGDLLERPILAVLATHRRDGTVLLSPVWHEWRDGGFSMVVWAEDIKIRHLRRDARATVLVAEHTAPYRGIEIRGEARILSPPDLPDILRRMANRYVGAAQAEARVDEYLQTDLHLVRLEPGRIRAWDFQGDFEG